MIMEPFLTNIQGLLEFLSNSMQPKNIPLMESLKVLNQIEDKLNIHKIIIQPHRDFPEIFTDTITLIFDSERVYVSAHYKSFKNYGIDYQTILLNPEEFKRSLLTGIMEISCGHYGSSLFKYIDQAGKRESTVVTVMSGNRLLKSVDLSFIVNKP